MTKDVTIKILGVVFDPQGSDEQMEVNTVGTYYFKDRKHYLLFEEKPEASKEGIRNRIRFDSQSLHLKKSGETGVNLLFEEGKKNVSTYVTPFGSFPVGVRAEEIRVTETETCIEAEIGYTMEFNETESTVHRIHIVVRAVSGS